MDYFSVIVLIIVTFIFISDRSIKSIENIQKELVDVNVKMEINYIKRIMSIEKMDVRDINYTNINKTLKDSKCEYILIQNAKLDLSDCDLDKFIANYIACDKKPCGFNILYTSQDKKKFLKKIYIDIINYLNIFNIKRLSTYGVIICSKSDFEQDEKTFEKNIVSHIPEKSTYIELTDEQIKTNSLKKIYIYKIKEADFQMIMKFVLLIISGSYITTNLIFSIINVNNNINGLIISIVIYYCYSYIIRYVYKPIGKGRIIATYIFPIYFISYIIIGIYTLCSKVINSVHAS